MGTASRDRRDERRAAVAAVRAAQERADRRRRRIVVAVVVLVVVGLAVPVGLVLADHSREQSRQEAAAASPIPGEVEEKVASAEHVTGDVAYPTPSAEPAGTRLPPLGGDHDPTPQNCGFYDQPVRDENAVHSLEHGAVWLAYRPGLDAADVGRIKDIATTTPYVLASPYDDLAAPIVATAWGIQLELDSTSDARLGAFLQRYVQGPQTPEPGAPCSGGVGAPLG